MLRSHETRVIYRRLQRVPRVEELFEAGKHRIRLDDHHVEVLVEQLGCLVGTIFAVGRVIDHDAVRSADDQGIPVDTIVRPLNEGQHFSPKPVVIEGKVVDDDDTRLQIFERFEDEIPPLNNACPELLRAAELEDIGVRVDRQCGEDCMRTDSGTSTNIGPSSSTRIVTLNESLSSRASSIERCM